MYIDHSHRKCYFFNTPSFGPCLQTFLAAQSAEGFISRRKPCALASYFGIKVSLGSTCNILKRAANLLKSWAKKIQEHVLQQGRIHADETSWRVAKKKSYLWVGGGRHQIAPFLTLIPLALPRPINAFLKTVA